MKPDPPVTNTTATLAAYRGGDCARRLGAEPPHRGNRWTGGQVGEVLFHEHPVAIGSRAIVVADQRLTVAPGVPRPGGVSHVVRICPLQERRDVRRPAVRSVEGFARLA